MAKSLHTTFLAESNSIYPPGNLNCLDGQNKLSSSIRRHLALVDRQYIATKINVNEATICRWISGEKNIPQNRCIQILREAKLFHRNRIKESLDANDQIEWLLQLQYGPQNGHSSRGGYV